MLYLYYNSNISDNIQAVAFKLGMAVDLFMEYMLMLFFLPMTLTLFTLMQSHSGSAEKKFSIELF